MRILGIDPGVSGACAIVTEAGHYVSAFDMPTVLANKSSNRRMVNAYELAGLVRRALNEAQGDIVAVIENVNAMPDQGVASVFAFGKSYGIVLGVLAALGLSTELVTAARWKKHFGLERDKEQARELATRMFPLASLPLKKDHNKAEALLLARWYRDTQCRAFEPAAA
jgi:Holliday junction resolvasome RuvABC endonuclease subunit